jgi:hypothetical protein
MPLSQEKIKMIENKPNDIPSGPNYTITDPATGVMCTATTFEGLVNRVGQVRSAMGTRAGLSLREEVEKMVCQLYPQDCTGVDMATPRKRNLNLTDVIRGTVVLASFVAGGSVPVPREEAERRAQICLQCQYNVRFPTPCTGVCGELLSIAQRVAGGHGTQYDRGLHACSICACYNAAQIWIPMEHLKKGVTEDMVKQFAAVKGCWKQVNAE